MAEANAAQAERKTPVVRAGKGGAGTAIASRQSQSQPRPVIGSPAACVPRPTAQVSTQTHKALLAGGGRTATTDEFGRCINLGWKILLNSLSGRPLHVLNDGNDEVDPSFEDPSFETESFV